MWTSGRLAEHRIDQVLLLLAARSSTGTLSVEGEDVLAIRFRNGDIIGADALKESLTHGLGRILVAAGHLNRDQIAAVEATELEGTAIDHLLAAGMVPAETLAGCVRQHTYLLLLRLLGWKAGVYQFYEGEVATSLPLRPLTVEEILVRASEEDPRLLGATIAPLGADILRPLLGRRAFRVLNWQQATGLTEESELDLWLTPFEDALLRSLDGLTPAHDFKNSLGVDEYRLRFALHRLNEAGLVERVGVAAVAGRLPVVRPAPAPPPDPDDAAPAVAAGEAAPAPEGERPPTAATRAARWGELGGQLGDLSRLFSYTLSAGLAILVLVLVLAGGSAPRLLHPFPWQEGLRQRLETLRITALQRDVVGKLKTYHILYGSFPLDLRPLVDTGLLRQGDLEDSHGRGVVFEALDQGFVLGMEEQATEATENARSRFSVTGDFLLDPDFAQVEGRSGDTAIQLLD
jgi:hypothetical protein